MNTVSVKVRMKVRGRRGKDLVIEPTSEGAGIGGPVRWIMSMGQEDTCMMSRSTALAGFQLRACPRVLVQRPPRRRDVGNHAIRKWRGRSSQSLRYLFVSWMNVCVERGDPAIGGVLRLDEMCAPCNSHPG